MKIETYLFFEGRCEEAIEFYRKALGAKIDMLMRYRESPEPAGDPHGAPDKVMHAQIRSGDATLMMSDGFCKGNPSFNGFGVSLTLPDEEAVNRAFAALAEGGEARMPPRKTFYSARFAMVQDRFGLLWMLTVPMSA